MFCCACAGSCNHVGNHSFCQAHGGTASTSFITFKDNTTWTLPGPTPKQELVLMGRAAKALDRMGRAGRQWVLRRIRDKHPEDWWAVR